MAVWGSFFLRGQRGPQNKKTKKGPSNGRHSPRPYKGKIEVRPFFGGDPMSELFLLYATVSLVASAVGCVCGVCAVEWALTPAPLLEPLLAPDPDASPEPVECDS
jgi:hypothetical protein